MSRTSHPRYTLTVMPCPRNFGYILVGLARNLGFNARELRRLQSLVSEHEAEFLEAWNGHFGIGGR